jgi:hypothetical protein
MVPTLSGMENSWPKGFGLGDSPVLTRALHALLIIPHRIILSISEMTG